MKKQPTQLLFSFDPPASDASPPAAPAAAVSVASYQPSSEALAALSRLETRLTDPETGKPSALGQEALYAIRQALVEGRNGWLLKAEDMLEALAVRNDSTQGDDIPAGRQPAEGADFQQAIEDVLDALQERVVGKRR